MTAQELIEALSQCNPSAEVVTWRPDQYGNPRVESLEWTDNYDDAEVYLS